jgi:hypothetical protein
VEQPAQLGEGEIVGDAVGDREQHVAVFYRNLLPEPPRGVGWRAVPQGRGP